MGKLIATWVCVPFAMAACAWLNGATQAPPTLWELACQDVAAEYEIETCDYSEPDIVRESILVQELTGAMGVAVYDEWRIYLAPQWYIALQGYTVENVLYHEMIHMVLQNDNPLSRCDSEGKAREMTDKRYGTESSKVPWRVFYRCTDPRNMM